MPASVPDIIQFVRDPQLLGLSLSPAQETLLRAIYGLPLTRPQRELWHLCTGRESYPAQPFSEVTILAGARSASLLRRRAPRQTPWHIFFFFMRREKKKAQQF